MHIFYVDESYDQARFVLTALGLREDSWLSTFEAIKLFRKDLARDYGIRVSRELHAKTFIRDCSDGVAKGKLSLTQRREVFEKVLRHMATLPVRLFNVCLDVPKCGSIQAAHLKAVERMANRVERTMKAKKSHAVVVFDRGKEKEITKLVRKMAVVNFVPSRFQAWPDGSLSKNIAIQHYIEDPFFKPSDRSYFLQYVDFAAFALLKREVVPTPFIARWGYEKLWSLLEPVRFLPAATSDPNGIVRR